MIEPITANEMTTAFTRMTFEATASKPEKIVASECLARGLSFDELRSAGRTHRLAFPRQEIMDRLWRETDLTKCAIGKMFNRDHTAVGHAIKAVAKRANRDISFDCNLVSAVTA